MNESGIGEGIFDQVENENNQSQFQVMELKPSMLTDGRMKKLKLVDLVTQGYDLQVDKEEAIRRTFDEYDGDDAFFTTFLATKDGRAVGSFSLNLVTQSEDDPIGRVFWDSLKEADAELATRAEAFSKLACNVWGVITLPSERQQGITTRLLTRAVEVLKPSIIVGNTKTPEAVVARANALGNLGYRTFYGDAEVTPEGNNPHTNIHESVLSAYLTAGETTLNPDGTLFSDADNLLPNIPIVDGFPSIVQESFQDVIAAQKHERKKTIVKPLLSVKEEVLAQ